MGSSRFFLFFLRCRKTVVKLDYGFFEYYPLHKHITEKHLFATWFPQKASRFRILFDSLKIAHVKIALKRL
jgi:hypothetical protein